MALRKGPIRGGGPSETPGTEAYKSVTKEMEEKLAHMKGPRSTASKKQIGALEKEIRKRGGNTNVNYKGRLISGGNKGK